MENRKKALRAVLLISIVFAAIGCGVKQIQPPDGIWETASMGYEYYGISQPEYYVEFTDTEVQYEHEKDGELVLDHANKIVSLEKTETGGYLIQVETPSGGQYTYRTGDSEEDVLEYYATWDEEDFSHQYSAGASLWKCN